MVSEEKLKPCPFCGGEALLTATGNDHTKKRFINIKCQECKVQRTDGAIRHDMDWLCSVAVKLWNNRTTVPLPVVEEVLKSNTEFLWDKKSADCEIDLLINNIKQKAGL